MALVPFPALHAQQLAAVYLLGTLATSALFTLRAVVFRPLRAADTPDFARQFRYVRIPAMVTAGDVWAVGH